jgi:multiple sugar transport system permease protein
MAAASSYSDMRRSRLKGFLGRQSVLGYTLVFPALLFLGVFIAYPFLLGIWFSLTDKKIGGGPGHFVGLHNFQILLNDTIFQQAVVNSLVYTISTILGKIVLGIALALLMNQYFPFKNFVRAALLLPWIVPTALSTLAWLWLFDPSFSILNRILASLFHIGRINWLGDPTLAMISIIVANMWRGVPFFAITLLAGLQTIPQELYEAADIDGASTIDRFRHITLPLIQPVLLLVVLFSFVWTIADFQLVYILTHGGPTNSTHLFGTLAYQVVVRAGRLGEGAAISLCMLPFLLVCMIAVLWQVRRD